MLTLSFQRLRGGLGNGNGLVIERRYEFIASDLLWFCENSQGTKFTFRQISNLSPICLKATNIENRKHVWESQITE